MDRESLKKSGLLEQYVLGLTNREETELVKQLIEEDLLVRQDYQELCQEMEGLIISQGIANPTGGRVDRTIDDVEALDYEVALDITRKNHALTIWRLALGVSTLVLLLLCGWFYRLYVNQRAELLIEKALHVQDRNSYQLKIQQLDNFHPDWNALATEKAESTHGVVLLHHLKEQHLVLLDLSHTNTLGEEMAYLVYVGEDSTQLPRWVIPGEERLKLHPITLENNEESIKIFVAKTGEHQPYQMHKEELIADLSLPETTRNRTKAPR